MNKPETKKVKRHARPPLVFCVSLCLSFYLSFYLLGPTAWCAATTDSCHTRLRFIENGLANARSQTKTWATVWGITWGVATGAQLAIASSIQNSDTRTDLWVGSASSALGLIPTWIIPPKVTQVDPLSTSTAESDDCAVLTKAEFLLEQGSDNDAMNTGWIAHTSNIAVNAAVALVLGAGFGHWGAAGISAAAGIPVGELMILTYPKAASRLQNRYQKGDFSEVDTHWQTRWMVMPVSGGGGLALSTSF